jgi:hypothetical protein
MKIKTRSQALLIIAGLMVLLECASVVCSILDRKGHYQSFVTPVAIYLSALFIVTELEDIKNKL